jgi:hypothetical protein
MRFIRMISLGDKGSVQSILFDLIDIAEDNRYIKPLYTSCKAVAKTVPPAIPGGCASHTRPLPHNGIKVSRKVRGRIWSAATCRRFSWRGLVTAVSVPVALNGGDKSPFGGVGKSGCLVTALQISASLNPIALPQSVLTCGLIVKETNLAELLPTDDCD